ncbi:hypothetical protein KIV10_12450, partial [Aequorivita echinoideorum]|nr:hypothetical protein [Aequorivita echinoideorum]
MKIKTTLGCLLTFAFSALITVNAQIKDPFTPRYSETVRGNFTTIANNMLSRTATSNYNGEASNHDFDDNVYVDIDNDNSTFNSSNATFAIPGGVTDPSCLVIKKAYLYWAAADKEKDNGDDNQPNWNYNNVKLRLPGQNSYATYTADEVFYRGRNEHFSNDPYICIKDITSQVLGLNNPFGVYQVANVEAKRGELFGHDGANVGTSGGWQIVFVYEEDSMFPRNITIFDGYAHVTSSTNNFNIDFNGFQTVPNGPVNADVVFGALEGDRDLSGDMLQIRNTQNNYVNLSTPQRSADNFFNSKITRYGQNVTDRTPASQNTLGFDAGIFVLDNTNNSILANGQNSARIRLTSNQETYGLYLVGFSVEVYRPELSPMLLTTSLAPGNTINAGSEFDVSFNVKNYGNDNAKNTTISYQLPSSVDYVSANSLPSGVSVNYNSTTRTVTFTIANNKVRVGDPQFTINFKLKVNRNCSNLNTDFQVQTVANYIGNFNPNPFSTVSSTDVNACGYGDLLPTTIHINGASQIQLSHTKVDVGCNGASTGSIDLSVTGGTPPYTYLWSNGATTQDLNNIPAGQYTVVVKDANNCEKTQTITINQPAALLVNVTKQNANGSGNCANGQATATVSGGTGPFTYLWSASANNQTTATATNLPTGTHTVKVTDSKGCMVEKTITIFCDISGWNFTCGQDKVVDEYGYNANCNVTTNVAIPNASNVYQYVVEIVYKGNNPGSTIQFTDSSGNTRTLERSVPVGTSSDIWVYRGLFIGNTNSVNYANNQHACSLQSVLVYAFRNMPSASSSSGQFTSLSGVNNVVNFTLNVPSFTAPRDLIIETPISELTTDGRYLLVKATAGSVTNQTIIYGPDASLPGGTCCLAIPTLTLNNVPGNVTQVTITVDTRNNQNGQSVNGQSWAIAGGVNVDADCFEELDITLQGKTDILCYGGNTGSITVAGSGGVPPLQYSLNGGTPQASPTFNNLTAGAYTIVVSDSIGNNDTLNVTLNQPANPLSVVITKVNATTAQGCNNGSATATPGGGTAPYTYAWSASAGNQTTATAINLPSGTHTVTITDANGCILEQGVVIDCVNTCDAIITVDNITNVLCTNNNTGSATVSASSVANPNATFTFTWNTNPVQVFGGVTSSTISNLTAGVYTVSVTIDGTVCQPVEQSITITQPANVLTVTTTSTDENGPNTGDGTATATASGGTPPYSYVWSPGGQTTPTITGLGAGNYTVTVTDANGCIATSTTTVNPGTCLNLSVTASATPTTCNGDSDGTATANVTGGSGSISYLWSPGGQTTQTISNLAAGTYTVTVSDSVTQCTSESTVTVNQPDILTAGIAITNVDCFGNNTGSLDLTVSGGTAPYSFVWSPNGETTEDLFNLVAGNYSVVITDVNGCTITKSATVNQPTEALSLEIVAQTNILCNGKGSVTVEAGGGTAPYLYNLDGGTPQASGQFNDLDTGTYTINVIDANGCSTSIEITLLKNCIIAIDDINDTFVDLPVSGDVGTNDQNPDGPAGTEVFTLVSGPSN